MEHIYGFVKLGHIEDSKRTAFIPNPDFLDSRPDSRHWLPIIRLFPLLNFEQLESSRFLDTVRKPTKIIP